MKERPILFKAEMVRAILDGRKTQTRRIVKPRMDSCGDLIMPGDSRLKCPHGQPGDRLWVRETFRSIICDNPDADDLETPKITRTAYRADVTPEGIIPYHHYLPEKAWRPWKPSIFMPRAASRITLEIVHIRIERLNDITEEDAKAEGIKPAICSESGEVFGYHDYMNADSLPFNVNSTVSSFRSLWKSINGSESWDANPWVWVVEFRKAEGYTK